MVEQAQLGAAVLPSISAPRAAEELLRLFNAIEDYGVFVVGLTGDVIVWHPCAERVLGYQAQEILGRNFNCLYPPDDTAQGRPQHDLTETARLGRVEREDWRVRKDGSRFWAFNSISPMRDATGQIWAFGKVIRDLTERRRAETMFRSVIDNADDCIITTDVRGKVLLFNQAAEKTFGYSAAEIVGQNVRVLMPEPYRGNHDTYMSDYVRTGNAKILGIGREVVGRNKDGSTFPLHLQISEFFLDDQRHFIGIVRDLTASKRLEEQLRQSQKMDAIGQLAGGVAHDFNNLLTVICGYSELLLEGLPANAPNGKMLADIRDAGERAAALTRQLLAFSRKQVLEPRVLQLNDVVGRVEKMLRRLIGEDVRLTTDLDPATGPVKVDPGQFEQVVINLAINARDAMPHGGQLTLETRNVEWTADDCPVDGQPGRYARLTMTDTGRGMGPDVRVHIFEPFFTTKEAGKGTGLGLATVYGIVKQSNGHITVTSEPGRGSTFNVYLPHAREPLSPPESVLEDGVFPRGSETVLLVEDEESVRNLVEQVLHNCGYLVLSAADGPEAVRVAQSYQGTIHVLITDVIMPHMPGSTVAEQVTAIKPGVKVLFVSGYTDDAVVRHGIDQAESPFLQKPFSPITLAQKVHQVLGRQI